MAGTTQTGDAVSIWRPYKADPHDWYTDDEITKADSYLKPLRRVLFAGNTLRTAALIALIATHAVADATPDPPKTNWFLGLVIAVTITQVVTIAVDLPFSAWRELGYDKRWGFSKQTTNGFVTDAVKMVPLSVVLYTLMFAPLWAVIRATDLWWIPGWAVFAVIQITISILFPIVIFPLFNKYTPLEDGDLRSAILDMAARVGADIDEIKVEDTSKRDTRPNAYVAGLGKVRRVVLTDNILRYPDEAVLAVVAHEIGHWKLKHIARQIPAAIAATFVAFAVLGALLGNDTVLDFAGVDDLGDPGAFPLFMLGFLAITKVTALATSWLSRAYERHADVFAYDVVGVPDALTAFFHDVSVENLMDLRPSRWKRISHSHPPFAERMAMAKAFSSRPAAAPSTP